mmetsp:Transcript_70343/g.211586  ORF Transcript_70343/g.211586 Transcript_70343/m.211586 type:complete len:84 (+) Transcript_70343:1144-1395(+)
MKMVSMLTRMRLVASGTFLASVPFKTNAGVAEPQDTQCLLGHLQCGHPTLLPVFSVGCSEVLRVRVFKSVGHGQILSVHWSEY